jgi:secreted PhoX family phosphatase
MMVRFCKTSNYIDNFMKDNYNRRQFISFLGKAGIGAVVMPQFLISCGNTTTPTNSFSSISKERLQVLKNLALEGLVPSDKDDLLLANGLDYHTIIKWGDTISDTDTFGFNNDFTCFIPFEDNNPKDGLLWVNHEYVNPLFVSDFDARKHENPQEHRTIAQVDKEMYNVGGSIVRIREENGIWKVVKNDPHNRRITAKTPMKLNWDTPIKGATTVIGTHSNCSGGITPWKTFFTFHKNPSLKIFMPVEK